MDQALRQRRRSKLIGLAKGRTRFRMTALGPALTSLLLVLPVLVGLCGTILPAFGFLPALGGTGFSLEPFTQLMATPGILRSAGLSLGVGLATSMIALGVVMLFVAGWSGTAVFARLQRLIAPLLSVPHAAAAFGLAFLIAPSGFLVRLVSPELTGWTAPPDVRIPGDHWGLSLIAGLVAKEIPFLFLITLAALPQVDAQRGRAAIAALRYGRTAGFLLATWPAIYRQIRLGVFAVIAFSTSVVDVAAILGPSLPPTLSIRLVQWMVDPDLTLRFVAAAGALLQLGVTACALAIWIGLEHGGAYIRKRLAASGRRWRKDALLRTGSGVVMTLSAVSLLLGLVTLAIWSFAGLWTFPDALPQSLTLSGWNSVGPRLGQPLLTTLSTALAATLIAAIVVVLCLAHEDRTGRRAGRRAMWLIYLPLIVPQSAFLFGLQHAFIALDWQATMFALVLVHLIFVLPYLFLALSDPWRAFDRRYERVAAGLGRSGRATFWLIRLPLLTRAILTAAAIGFAVSVGQYLPTVLIGAGRLTTVTTEAVALASGGNRRVIGVWAFVQMILPFLGFLVATLVPALIFRRFRGMRI
jgi:putative thiamine transport system permease protein